MHNIKPAINKDMQSHLSLGEDRPNPILTWSFPALSLSKVKGLSLLECPYLSSSLPFWLLCIVAVFIGGGCANGAEVKVGAWDLQ